MKKILIIFLVLCCPTLLLAKKINFTGICYDDVEIISKRVKISNPVPITYKKVKDKIIYKENIPVSMKSAGYWISKIENPDEIILNKKQIKNFNNKYYNPTKLYEHKNIVELRYLTETFNTRLSWFDECKYIDSSLNKVSPDFFTNIQKAIDINYSDIFLSVQFAISTKYCEVRVLPTDISIYPNYNSLDIDKFQEESIDIGTPLVVLCQTKNKDWSYVKAPKEEGWIKTSNIAFTDKKTLKKWIECKKIAVITDTKADIFMNKELKEFNCSVRMGTVFPLISKNSNRVVIKVPTADENGNLVTKKGYILRDNVNIGFMKYTKRNVLIQAFKHLNSPYSWGGQNCEQDCSGLLGQIFNCFGIILPETSAQKIMCGKVTKLVSNKDIETKKQIIVNQAVPALSLIYLPGHIMLYIGNEDKQPYVLHDIWGLLAFNEDNEATILYINKVVVSDLDLGNNVEENSLIQRVTKFSILN